MSASGQGSTRVEIQGLSKSFGDVRVLEDLDLTIEAGEIVALLGLSGSGKTTALRLLAGFETPDAGRILVSGPGAGSGPHDVSAQPPRQRGFGMVFQHYALFPHMSVRENVAFGLESQGWAKDASDDRVAAMLRLVDLEGLGHRQVSEISGGQQQRIALARALAPSPRLLLLDEPLSNLDPSLRERTRRELREAVREVGITTVLVTHEQEEAFHVGDRVAVLHRGRLEQVGTPRDLYRRPATRFVASFVGRAGALPGTVAAPVEATGGGATIQVDVGAARPWRGEAADPDARFEVGQSVELVVRPETLSLAPTAEVPGGLQGTVRELRFTGATTFAVVELPTATLAVACDRTEPTVGSRVAVDCRSDDASTTAPTPRVFPAPSVESAP